MYVLIHRADHEAAFAPQFDRICRVEETVRACREAIRDIKGVVCCEKCGSDVPKTSAFCSVCGQAMPGFEAPVITDSQMRCAVCGKLVEKSAQFCTSCGMPLSLMQVVPPVEEIVPPAEEIVPPVEEVVPPVEEIVPPMTAFSDETTVLTEQPSIPLAENAPVSDETVVLAPSVPCCVTCGQPLKEGAAFCIHCGTRVDAVPMKRFCTQCGKEASPTSRFCTGCGHTL